MAFVRLRHVSWQRNDLEPNFIDAEPPPLFPPQLAFRSVKPGVEHFQTIDIADASEAAARNLQEFSGCLSCTVLVLATSTGFV